MPCKCANHLTWQTWLISDLSTAKLFRNKHIPKTTTNKQKTKTNKKTQSKTKKQKHVGIDFRKGMLAGRYTAWRKRRGPKQPLTKQSTPVDDVLLCIATLSPGAFTTLWFRIVRFQATRKGSMRNAIWLGAWTFHTNTRIFRVAALGNPSLWCTGNHYRIGLRHR